MPTYEWKCNQCGNNFENFMKIQDFKVPHCCGSEMNQVYGHKVFGDMEPYWDNNLGDKPVFVKSKQHRKELMRDAKVYEAYGKGWV